VKGIGHAETILPAQKARNHTMREIYLYISQSIGR
jgi:hypothetical protein